LTCQAVRSLIIVVKPLLEEPAIKKGLDLPTQVEIVIGPNHLPLSSSNQKKTPTMVPTLVEEVAVEVLQVIMVSY